MLENGFRYGACKRIPLFNAVVLVHGGQNIEGGQCFSHRKSPNRIHIGGDNRYARPGLTGMLKGEFTFKFNVGATFQSRTFRADKYVFET
ncbi:hypothetical protein D3C76_1424020 [compost metagenome]